MSEPRRKSPTRLITNPLEVRSRVAAALVETDRFRPASISVGSAPISVVAAVRRLTRNLPRLDGIRANRRDTAEGGDQRYVRSLMPTSDLPAGLFDGPRTVFQIARAIKARCHGLQRLTVVLIFRTHKPLSLLVAQASAASCEKAAARSLACADTAVPRIARPIMPWKIAARRKKLKARWNS